MADEWGPLAALAGEWEGEGGLDRAYSHGRRTVVDTAYREKLTFTPFGPVDNGQQRLYGLDYRTTMWPGDDDVPFHTEVGYWLWDAASGEILRAFVVPRGISVLAGGTASADATSFTLNAEAGHPRYAIGENEYLAKNASARSYRVTIDVHDDGTWSYEESTILHLNDVDGPFDHRDRNTLRRVS